MNPQTFQSLTVRSKLCHLNINSSTLSHILKVETPDNFTILTVLTPSTLTRSNEHRKTTIIPCTKKLNVGYFSLL